jgi:hypothetical protein
MIRIDEIYNNTFWPYIQKQLPLTRMFYCDPPGKSDPEHLCNYGSDITEHNYIILHDQEPIHLDIHMSLFEDTVRRNKDLNYGNGPLHKAIITSEYCSEDVVFLEKEYGWKSYYYFFHGWAALDWYRGYHRTFLHQPKNIQYTFLCPNNIVGGKRSHRLELFDELAKRNLLNTNLVSMPAVCPYEGITVKDYINSDVKLPLVIDSFDNHANNSHQITLWKQASESLIQVVTETVFLGDKNHLTEKTFKPIVMQQPFVIAGCKGSLEYLRKYGFETFSSVWDESYDTLPDDQRIAAIGNLLQELEHSNCREWLSEQCAPIVEHNFNHFYGGAFEKILWEEITDMLEQLENDFCI